MKDAVARRGVVRLPDAVQPRELAADGGLLVIILLAREDEVIVGDGRLPRKDRVAAGNLVEGMDRERRGAVRGGQQIRIDAQRGSGADLSLLVDAMGPDDLFGRRHAPGLVCIRPFDARRSLNRRPELAPAGGDDPAGAPNFIFLDGQRHRNILFVLRVVREPARPRVEAELVAVARVGHGLRTLHHVQAEIERVPAKDVAHVGAADHDHLETHFFGHALEPGRAHLARRSDREPIAGNQKVLSPMDPRAEIGHEVAKRSGFPAQIERLEAFRDAVRGWCDLIGVDRIELLLLARDLQVPEDERLAVNRGVGLRRVEDAGGSRDRLRRKSRFQPGWFNRV